MRFQVPLFLAYATLAYSAPASDIYAKIWGKRQTPTTYGPHGIAPVDYATLILASNLELLELNLFIQGLANYSSEFSSLPNDYLHYTEVHKVQETEHYGELNSLLYGMGPKNCTYTFPGVYDAKSFNKMAQVITSVGEGAFLGSTANLTNKDYIAVLATIVTSEARQNSYLRFAGGLDFYNGGAAGSFDTALTATQAYSLASPMISNCPSSNPAIPFKALPAGNATFTSGAATGQGGQGVSVAFKSKIDFSGTSALIISGPTTYRAGINADSDGMKATFTLPPQVTNGTVFVLFSNAEGTPFPVPDSSVKGIAPLVVD